MSRKRKMPKRKSIVTCMADIPNFTKGKDYRVLGHAPKYRLILTNDKGKREFPMMKDFKRIGFIDRLRYYLKIKKL